MSEFGYGEAGIRSRSAIDDYPKARRRSGSLRAILIAALGSFLLGAALVGYIAYRSDLAFQSSEGASVPSQVADTEPAGQTSPSPTPTATETGTAQVEAVERVAEQQGGIEQRLAAAEQRLARLDLQAQAAAGNTARAEGLLIAFAARRALERGAELGYLADQLRLRFGDALPNAVRTVVATSRDPITLDQLIARLEGLAPELADAPEENGFARLRRELSELFIIRRESAPSPQPQRRLDRARLFLESGRVESAIAEVRNLPGAEQAESWIADAHRYAAAKDALDLIETAAVLEPRRLRDGAGNRVQQPSPAQEPAAE